MALAEQEPFLEYRPLLFSIAYRMLGGVADAEDAVQETYLRWHRAHMGDEEIHNPKGWLTTTLSRVCLDILGSARKQREQYIGPWLPEPIAGVTPDIAETTIDFDSLSTAFMVLLESLSPKERAVFLLHDVFRYDFATVGEIVGESEAYCRQLAKRARAHMSDRRPRFVADPSHRDRLTSLFAHAVSDGDMPALLEILAEDVVVYSDGGGKVSAARRPVVGRDKVATFLTGIRKLGPADIELRIEAINGQPGLITSYRGMIYNVTTFDIADAGICAIYIMANPDKLQPIADSLAMGIVPPEMRKLGRAIHPGESQ